MDQTYMRRALELAKRGLGHVNPNPMVGAVAVRDGKIIGEGYHKQYGGPHAEVNLAQAAGSLQGATVYVTLEPCAHHGKTPPCADLLVRHNIARAVIGCLDPNPLVAGQGVQRLREAGIAVECGVLEDECRALNRVFFHYITHGTPYVVWKTAMTLDGKIATCTGESKWITGESARKEVQTLRHWLQGILVGVNTVLADDPQLTCRLEHGVNPVRIIADSRLRIPLSAKVLQNQPENQTILATTAQSPPDKRKALEALGAKVLVCQSKQGQVDLTDLMRQLGQAKIDSLLLEGGSQLSDAAFREGIVHRAVVYIAPKVVGGDKAKTPVGGLGIAHLPDAVCFCGMQAEPVGEDWRLTADVRRGAACLPEL